MYRYLYSKLVYPLYHGLIGSGAVKASRELDSHDIFTIDQLHVLEEKKLQYLLEYANRNVPYYREIISKTGKDTDTLAGSPHFQSFPILSKSIIRRQGERLHSQNLGDNKIDSNSTSGSSGSPLRFFTDRHSKSFRKAALNRNRRWLGIHIGDPIVHLWGSPIDQQLAEALRGRIRARVTRETFLSAYKIGDDDFAKYAGIIQRTGARLLVGYPSVLTEFANFCGVRAIRFPRLQAVISSAEALYGHHRKDIEQNFGVPLYNRYGSREVGDIAHEIPGQNGLVVNSDRILVEIINNNGEPCAPGVLGQIIVTDLDNLGMPFIRYDIGDLGCWAQSATTDGTMPYPVLESVEGRSLDIVTSSTGARVGGTFWTILFRERPGIDQFQVIQEKANGVRIRYTSDANAETPDFNYFSEKIRDILGAEFFVTYEGVDRIDPEPSGKHRIVVSRLGQDPPIPTNG